MTERTHAPPGRVTLNAPRLDAGEIEVFEWR